MTDLNTLIPPSSNLNVLFGSNISNSGEITGATVNAQGVERAVLLIPRGRADVLPNGASVVRFRYLKACRCGSGNPRSGFWDLRTAIRR
jgi:hypothetical protein